MLIPLSLRSVRVACKGARIAAIEGSKADRAKAREVTYNQLLEGAIHNGLKPTDADLKVAADMADRDVEHAMESHKSHHIIKHLDTMLEMADYYESHDEDADAVVISNDEFLVLKDHLPNCKQDNKKD